MSCPHDPGYWGENSCVPTTSAGKKILLEIRREAEEEGATWSHRDEDRYGKAIRDIEKETQEVGREEERLIASIFGPQEG